MGIITKGMGVVLNKFLKPKISKTISSVAANIPKTKLEKIKSGNKILEQKAKASAAKLENTKFEIQQRARKNEMLTGRKVAGMGTPRK